MINENDLYKLLGIDKGASQAEIKRARDKKALEYHPDRTQTDTTEMMANITRAYEILSSRQRDEYDVYHSLFDDLTSEGGQFMPVAGYVATDVKPFSDEFKTLFSQLSAKYLLDQTTHQPVVANISTFESNIYTIHNNTKVSNIFSFVKAQEARNLSSEHLIDISKPLDLDLAIEIFTAFLRGECYGKPLLDIKFYFSAELTRLKSGRVGDLNIQFYDAVNEILHLTEILNAPIEQATEVKARLIRSMTAVSDYAIGLRVLPENLAKLFANKYFRNLHAQTVHLYTHADCAVLDADLLLARSTELAQTTLADLKQRFKDLLEDKQDKESKKLLLNLILTARSIKLLSKFDSETSKDIIVTDSEACRKVAFDMLDWTAALTPFPSTKVAANIYLQIGAYFVRAALSAPDRHIKIADEALALQMFLRAYGFAHRDLETEQYALTEVLKYLSLFQYTDAQVTDTVKALQTRLSYLGNIYPFLHKTQSNISVLCSNTSSISLRRNFLHSLLDLTKPELLDRELDIDQDYVVVLYQAYEACLRNWFESENEFNQVKSKSLRFELMQKLAAKNSWTLDDIVKNVDSPWVMLERDEQGWIGSEASIPFAVHPDLEKFRSLDAITINKKTGELSFAFKKSRGTPELDLLTMQDVAEMFEKSIYSAFFSLNAIDPDMPYHPYNLMHFGPSRIYKSDFFNTMLMTDYILKFFTVNREIRARGEFETRPLDNLLERLPSDLRNIIEEFHNGYSKEQMHRFWIEAEHAFVAQPEANSPEDVLKFAVDEVKMVVRKHALTHDINGNLIDKDEASEGWPLYVFSEQQKNDLQEGGIIIPSSAIILMQGTNNVYFYERNALSDVFVIKKQDEQLNELQQMEKDAKGKILIKAQDSAATYNIFKRTLEITKQAFKPHNFTKEYIFAQEFTANYNNFALYFPEFGRLRELSKVTILIRLIAEVNAKNKQRIEGVKKINQQSPHVTVVDERNQPINLQELENFDAIFASLGMQDLGKEQEVDLQGKCLWVPANLNQGVKNCLLVYGGVRVAPLITPLQRGTLQYNNLVSGSFTPRHVTYNSKFLIRTRQDAAQMTQLRFTQALSRASTYTSANPSVSRSTFATYSGATSAARQYGAQSYTTTFKSAGTTTTPARAAGASTFTTSSGGAASASGGGRGRGPGGGGNGNGGDGPKNPPQGSTGSTRTTSPKRATQLLPIRAKEIGTFRISADGDHDMCPEAAGTFAGSRYTKYVTHEAIVLYRTGNRIYQFGEFYTFEKPLSELHSRMTRAIPYKWEKEQKPEKSIQEVCYKILVPAGRIICAGEAGYQHGIFVGGHQQIYIAKPWDDIGIKVIKQFHIPVITLDKPKPKT